MHGGSHEVGSDYRSAIPVSAAQIQLREPREIACRHANCVAGKERRRGREQQWEAQIRGLGVDAARDKRMID
jgi:hypothetical protein